MNIEKIKKDITHHLNYVPEMSQTTYNALKGALDIINALEDIKAEINSSYLKSEKEYDKGRNDGLFMAIQIINKHIEGV